MLLKTEIVKENLNLGGNKYVEDVQCQEKVISPPPDFFGFCIFVTFKCVVSSNKFYYFAKITCVNTKCSFSMTLSFIRKKYVKK